MMGSQREADALTSLLALAADPEKVKDQLAKLQGAIARHKQVKEEAAKIKAEAEAAIIRSENRIVEVNNYAANTRKELDVELNKLSAERSKFESEKAIQDVNVRATLDKASANAANTKQLADSVKAAQEAHDTSVKEHSNWVAQVKASFLEKEKGLMAREQQLSEKEMFIKEREGKVAASEHSLAQRIQKMRDLVEG